MYVFFKNRKTFVWSNFAIVEKWFFSHEREFLFLILFFNQLIWFSKKNKIYHKMQREKLYSLQRTVYFLSVLFMLKEASNSVRPVFHNGKRLVVQSWSIFENKKYTIKMIFCLQFVELFTLHLVVYFFP
jgi:hypothetical protein